MIKINKKIIFQLILVLAIVSCQKDEWDYDFPYVKTISIENINDTSALFTGEIIHSGNEEIIDYGCNVNGVNVACSEIKNQEGIFNVTLSSHLRKNETIGIYAYAKTEKYTIYGKSIGYNCVEDIQLKIISIAPISGTADTPRTMKVENFIEGYNSYIKAGSFSITSLNVLDPNTIEFKLSHYPAGSYQITLFNEGGIVYPEELIVTAE